jgi:dihydrolipoamide dehydrogenase
VAAKDSVYDVIVIGSGPGGYVAAIRAGQLGLRAAIVEKDPFYGGTCLHRGCIPTKSLLHDAALFEQALEGLQHGILADNVRLDFAKVQERKGGVVNKLAKGVEFLLKKNNVEMIRGTGHLRAPDKVDVQTPDGDKRSLETRNVLLATGSVPRGIPSLEIDGVDVLNSDHVLELQQIPESMIILGAGAVGVEFASIYSRFGTKVRLIELMDRIVPNEDKDISRELHKALRKKMDIHVGTRFESLEKTSEGLRVTAAENGTSQEFTAQKLLVAIGRAPVSEGLGFQEVGIEMERGFVKVDEMMRSSVKGVYAIGDLVPTPAYAHTASSEGIVAVEHMAGHDPRPIRYEHVPNCTYCDPEIGSVGLTEEKARDAGYDVKVGTFPLSTLGKVLIIGEKHAVVKIVADARYGELLGVHILGPRATDLVAEACVALTNESTIDELVATMHAHPTVSEGIKEAAEAVFGSAIHI